MATVVSTGQITIVDNNDARPITAYITASNGVQQIYTKDESTVASTPDWSVANNVLTAKVFVGGTSAAIDVTAQLTNRKWSNDQATSIGSGVALTVNTNLDPGVNPQKIYYFEGDYTDPITGLVSHVIAQIALSVVRTGTNAVYMLPRGVTSIEESHTATKNVAVIAFDVIRAAGVDTTGITYQFFEANGAVQITSAMASKYGLKTTAAGASPTGLPADIGVNLPAANAWSNYNTLVVSENAVADMAVLRAVAKDADGVTYQCYVTVYDVTDPYDCKLISTAGEKLQNGIGFTNVYPLMYNGSKQLSVADTSAWTFDWYFYDKDGNRGGFIDTVRTAVAGGRSITSNTAGAGSVIAYSGAAITFAAGDMVKIVNAAGVAKYFEVASGTTNANLTLRTATISTFLNTPWPASTILANEFAGGKLYVCSGTGATAGRKATSGSGPSNYITATGDEIDGKGIITCEASRP